MRKPSIPRNEAARLTLLHSLGILDSPQDRYADAIVTAAASIANMPTAAISLVDADRQWFKARCGLEVQETGRDVSFCAHAMLDSDPLIVPDAQADPRFADNPLVTGAPFIRFYAGFPLAVDGLSLGALCLVDKMPRALSAGQIGRLKDLAQLTGAWLADAARRVQA